MTSMTSNRPTLQRFARFGRGPRVRRVLVLLPVLGLSIAATGCIAPRGFGVSPYYGDPYYNNSRGTYYGNGGYYSPRRPVIVQRPRVVVQRPVYQVHRKPVYRVHRPVVRQYRHAPRHEVRHHDRKRVEKYIDRRGDRKRVEKYIDRRGDRKQVRNRDRDRHRESARSRDRDREQRGGGGRRRY